MEIKKLIALEWHDAVIKSISMDRENPGHVDEICFQIQWPSEEESSLVFKDVYYAKLDLNFGIIAEETIFSFQMLDEQDENMIRLKDKWRKIYNEIDQVYGFEIKTNSTNSTIQVFAKAVIFS